MSAFRVRTLLALMAFGALQVAMILYPDGPGHARADAPHLVVTHVEWAGSPCLDYLLPSPNSPYALDYPKSNCIPGPPEQVRWAEWEQRAISGQVVGIDPNVGLNSWVSCKIYVDTKVTYTDYIAAGDRHEINCLRVLS